MDLTSIRQLSWLARCGFIERLKDPHIVCPEVVELLIKYSSNYKNPNHTCDQMKNQVSLI